MKITYFDARGRMDTARIMLELTGTPYEYEVIPLESWMTPECRERFLSCTPFGQLPVLEDGAFSLCQSTAISRYIAIKVGLYGATLEECARIDEVTETASEIFLDTAKFNWDPQFHEKRAEHREATGQKLEQLERYFTRTAADAEHWVVAGRTTLADIFAAYTLECLLVMHPGLVQSFPKLDHAMNAVFAKDRVRAYVRSDRRPRTFTVPMAQFGGKPEDTHQWTG